MARTLAMGPLLPDRPARPESPTTAAGRPPGPCPSVVPPRASAIGGSVGAGEVVVVEPGAPRVGVGSTVGVVTTPEVGVAAGGETGSKVGVGMPVGVGVGVGLGVGLGLGVGVTLGVGATVGVGTGVGTGVGLGVGSGVGTGVGLGVGSGVGSGVGLGVGSGVGTGVGFGLWPDGGASEGEREIITWLAPGVAWLRAISAAADAGATRTARSKAIVAVAAIHLRASRAILRRSPTSTISLRTWACRPRAPEDVGGGGVGQWYEGPGRGSRLAGLPQVAVHVPTGRIWCSGVWMGGWADRRGSMTRNDHGFGEPAGAPW